MSFERSSPPHISRHQVKMYFCIVYWISSWMSISSGSLYIYININWWYLKRDVMIRSTQWYFLCYCNFWFYVQFEIRIGHWFRKKRRNMISLWGKKMTSFFIYTLEPGFYLIALINSVSFGLILIFCCFIAMALIIISPFWRFNLLINTCT